MKNQKRKYRLLLVDDEPRVTSALRAIFRREYDVHVANSGDEALILLSKISVDVVVCDQRMPGMLGNELLSIISKRFPQTIRILLTGFMDKQAIVDTINEGEIYRFINKPWNNEELTSLVAEAALASDIPNEIVAQSENPDSPGEATSTSQAIPPNHAILMIEQKQEVRNQIRKFCRQEKVMIYGTQNIEQAVVAAHKRDNIGVAIVELSVDPKGSLQTINLLKRVRPELITIALTDQFDAHTAVDLINQGQVFKYLTKPIEPSSFQQTLQNAFQRHSFLKKNKLAQTRYKVENAKGTIVASLRNLFNLTLKPTN